MSSVGQLVGGLVGGVVGFFVGGPSGAYYGAQAGIMIGGAIDPPDGPVINGPRLDDLSVQTSTYGAFIPRNYGTIAQTGNVFWLKGDALTETARVEESGGKGGPTTTTNLWDYSATFALGLCEGPIDGIRRIWINGQLFYDAGSADVNTIIASNDASELFTLYYGTDTQSPDPLMQADKGAANVPAYRGLAYIVFDNLPLAKYNNSLAGAQIKVEIVKDATYSNHLIDSWHIESEPSWHSTIRGNGNPHDNSGFSNFIAFIDTSTPLQWVRRIGGTVEINNLSDESRPLLDSGSILPGASPKFGAMSVSDIHYAFSSGGSSQYFLWGAEGDLEGFNTGASFPTYRAFAEKAGVIYLMYSTGLSVWLNHMGPIGLSGNGRLTAYSSRINLYPYRPTLAVWGDYAVCARRLETPDDQPIEVEIYGESEGSMTLVDSYSIPFNNLGLVWNDGIDSDGHSSYVYDDKLYIASHSMTGSTFAPLIIIDLLSKSLFDRYEMPENFNVGGSKTAVRVVSGLTYISQSTTSSTYTFQYNAWQLNRMNDVGATTLGEIVESECLSSNLLESSDIDVTELTDSVRGYRIASLGALRGGIEPLRVAWPFDVIQHGYDIKFKRRGSASVVTINADELDARAAGESPGVQITNSREMDTLLPSNLRLNYIDSVREYDTNQQISDRGL